VSDGEMMGSARKNGGEVVVYPMEKGREKVKVTAFCGSRGGIWDEGFIYTAPLCGMQCLGDQ
jgi:hypothetical protein